MQKCIGINELRVGMFIKTFDGAWISHPFWRDNFLLDKPADLSRIRASGIQKIWIDTSKGLDVLPVEEDVVPASVDMRADQIPQIEQVSFSEELERAQKICARSKEAITTMFNEVRMGEAVTHEQANALVEEISDSVSRNPNALISLVRLKSANEYTYMHSVAVCALMIALARQLQMDEQHIREAGVAGLLHDIGKMAIPDAILDKAGKLTDREYSIIQNHPVAGGKILRDSNNISAVVIDVCEHHHEKYDGTGYPDRLKGEEISLLARMAAVCDVYDAITSDRCYRQGWEPADAIRKMAEWKGHFDERVFQAFIKTVGIYPVGALVRLESGRLGVVLEQHKKSLLTPKVKVFLSARTKMPILQEVIDLSKFAGSDKIVACESPEEWGVHNINELWSGLPANGGHFS